ncbi:MAG: hypothetical protein GKS00_24660 [Alphaproteobacteria bacterium]|nr:hypothetical protein [Alphaproteobacteria bacterium]
MGTILTAGWAMPAAGEATWKHPVITERLTQLPIQKMEREINKSYQKSSLAAAIVDAEVDFRNRSTAVVEKQERVEKTASEREKVLFEVEYEEAREDLFGNEGVMVELLNLRRRKIRSSRAFWNALQLKERRRFQDLTAADKQLFEAQRSAKFWYESAVTIDTSVIDEALEVQTGRHTDELRSNQNTLVALRERVRGLEIERQALYSDMPESRQEWLNRIFADLALEERIVEQQEEMRQLSLRVIQLSSERLRNQLDEIDSAGDAQDTERKLSVANIVNSLIIKR